MFVYLLYLGFALGLLGLLWFGLPLLHRAVQSQHLRKLCTRTHSIILTYDDGPGAELTPQLLELLAAHSAKATFFTLGFRAREHPETLRTTLEAGHEVGSHSSTHLNAWKTPPWKSIPDLCCDHWFKDLTGFEPTLVRPPYDKMILSIWLGSIVRGRRILWWTADSGDTWPALPDPAAHAQHLLNAGGGVILLHDFDRDEHADRNERMAYVLDFTREILTRGGHAGYRFCRYSDLHNPHNTHATHATPPTHTATQPRATPEKP